MWPGEVEDRREIDLEEMLGDRARALVVEPPRSAISENAPAERARGQVVDPPQIAQHLGRRRRLLAALPRSAVERALPALGFHHRQAELVAPPFLGETVGAVLCLIVREQQAIGYILPAVWAQILLTQTRRPAQPRKDRPDQIVFGLAFVGRSGEGEVLEDRPQRGCEAVEIRVVNGLPVGSLGNGLAEEVVGEKAALECGVDTHAPKFHESAGCFSTTP